MTGGTLHKWNRGLVERLGTSSRAVPEATTPRWRRRLVNGLLIALCVLFALLDAVHLYPAESQSNQATLITIAIIGTAAMITLTALLLPRREALPEVSVVMLAGAAILLPTTAVPALIALAALLYRRRGGRLWIPLVLTLLAVLMTMGRDLGARQSLILALLESATATGREFETLTATLMLLFTVLWMSPFVIGGMLRASAAERDEARQRSRLNETTALQLQGTLDQEQQRRVIAREVHDTLGSRLSILSMIAGGLSRHSELDPALNEDLTLLRRNAQQALDDFRHVVEVLHDPERLSERPRESLDQLDELVDEAIEAGQDVRARMSLSDVHGCDPQVAHTAYRIVQECLSNARKHAPGQSVSLTVRASPNSGVGIRVSTPRSAEPLLAAGSGTGQRSMRERVLAAGGTFELIEDDEFTVLVSLPWLGAVPGGSLD